MRISCENPPVFDDWDSPQWVWIGLLLGVLGILLGIFFAWWFARQPRLIAAASIATVISAPGHLKIPVLHDDETVKEVTQSIFWFWRRGRGVVRGSDVVPSDPVALSLPEGSKFLDVTLIQQSKDTNNVRLKCIDQRSWLIEFDYLDMRQG